MLLPYHIEVCFVTQYLIFYIITEIGFVCCYSLANTKF